MPVGKLLIAVGLLFVAAGIAVSVAGKLPFRLGRLPGDIYIHGRNTTFIFPLTTCILISVIFWLLSRFFRR